MAYRGDDDFDTGFSRDGSRLGGTSDFSTMLMNKDGTFLGIKLSPEMASNFRNFTAMLLPWLRRKTEHYGAPLIEKAAKGLNAADPAKWGRQGRNAIGYTTIFLPQILDTGRNIYDSISRLHELNNAVKPLTKAEGRMLPLSSDNEVLVNARHKLSSLFWQNMAETAISVISTAPALHDKWMEVKNDNKKRLKEEAYERGDIKAVRELSDHRSESLGREAAEHHQQLLQKTLRTEEAAYLRKYRKFKKDVLPNKLTRLKETIDSIKPDGIASLNVQLRNLRNAGIDTHSLEIKLNGKTYERDGSRFLNDKEKSEILKEFHDDIREDIKALAEKITKKEFVRKQIKEGSLPFDDEWAKYWDGNGERPDTIQRTIINELDELRKEKQKKDYHNKEMEISDASGNKIGVGTYAASLGAGIVSEGMRQKLFATSHEKYDQPIAIDRILRLQEVLREAGDNPPESLPSLQENQRDMSYAQYVHSIFQQHQLDSGRPAIGERFFENFGNAHWDDNAIQQLPDEKLTSYEYAVKTIAKRIKDGRMDAIALANLVGDKKKKIVQNDGRNFGPKGSRMNEADTKTAILKVIDEQTAIAHAGQKKTDVDINEKLGNFVFSVEDMKKALDTDTLPRDQRTFQFRVFSDAVGNEQELCKLLGLDEARCAALRKETEDTFNVKLDGAVLVIAEALQADPTLEKSLKLMDKEKEVILTLAERIKEEGKDVADLTADRQQLVTLETVVANAVMKGNGLWTKMVEKAKTIPDIIADAKKRREAEAAAPPPSEMPQQGESWPPGEQLPPAPEGGMDRHQRALAERTAREEPIVPGRA